MSESYTWWDEDHVEYTVHGEAASINSLKNKVSKLEKAVASLSSEVGPLKALADGLGRQLQAKK